MRFVGSLFDDHVVDRVIRRNHGQHMFLVGNFDVQHKRSIVVDHFVQRVREINLAFDCRRTTPVALGDRDKVGIPLLGIVAGSLATRFRVMDGPQVGVSPVTLEEAIFPLHHHAQMLVVQQQHLDRQTLAMAGRQFLDVHLETAIAVDVDYQRIRKGHLGSHRRWQAEAHRAQARAGEPSSGAAELVELGGPHLVLTDAYGNDRIPVLRLSRQFGDGMLLQNPIKRLVVLERIVRLPVLQLVDPSFDPALRLDDLVEFGQGELHVAHNRNVSFLVLVQFGGIDIDMHDLGVRSKLCHFSRDPVIKTDPQGDQQIAIPHSPVRIHAAMHAEHI